MPAFHDEQKPAWWGSPPEGDRYVFSFTEVDFHRIRELIRRQAGISLSSSKMDLVYSRLARRLRARGIATFAEYIDLLERSCGEETEAFVNALTTNMTSFFREPHHFPILSRHLAGLPPGRPVRIWTCASSTGEEPYSIAMTAVETFGTFLAPVRILATDIDTQVLERARDGIYPLDQLQKLSRDRLRRFFLRGEGRHAGFARIKPELRQLVEFRRLNLLDESWPMREPFDAIFCRNVMIYFDKPTQDVLLKKMAPRLKPEGLFFVGHSECFHHATEQFQLHEKTVYSLRKSS